MPVHTAVPNVSWQTCCQSWWQDGYKNRVCLLVTKLEPSQQAYLASAEVARTRHWGVINEGNVSMFMDAKQMQRPGLRSLA